MTEGLGRQQHERGEHGRSIVLEKRSVLRLDLRESREFFSERKGKVIPRGGTEDRKITGTDSESLV